MLLDELDLIDLTVKKFTRPTLELDPDVLEEAYSRTVASKHQLLHQLNVTKTQLMSDLQFGELLHAEGVTPPLKVSPRTGKMVFAFAKTDPELHRLKTHSDRVCKLVEARLAFKSTQEETRLARFSAIAKQTGNKLHVPLLYYGAHPGRFSGRDKINLQNLGRGSVLREAIVAPKGCKIVAGDLSQIEARITACLAGQWDLVDLFAAGEDVYASFATDVYGYPINADDHPAERFVGKTGILSLGFQSGAAKYCDTMNNVFGVKMTIQEAVEIVRVYRQKYKRIVKLWRDLGELIPRLHSGERRELGPVDFEHEKIILPNGMQIQYRDLKHDYSTNEWSYWNGRARVKLYGGKCLENSVQALARIVMTTAELRMARRGLSAALSVHDELVFVVKEQHAETVAQVVKSVMEQKVRWMPELPVKCEVKIGDRYSECK